MTRLVIFNSLRLNMYVCYVKLLERVSASYLQVVALAILRYFV